MNLIHYSEGSRKDRVLRLYKKPPSLRVGRFEEGQWVQYERPQVTVATKHLPDTISVACFNVLFNCKIANPHSASPTHVSRYPSFMDMSEHPQRRPHNFSMLEKLDVDILALQEVTADFHEELLKQEWPIV
eukprot:TRINITY_DN2974_c0_g1_i6.p1 TRINITY_DN2974_c0_g1~~TRINITY_DN2974_c0_g1_i6.p1  ORF type:complete len:131 (+),score=24.00 TRINITY_DN2974_c0_g1_i6:1100-1492(+)